MRVASASGKGGTGKTTVATNLAVVAARTDESVAYLDCDVEQPNGRIFLQPTMTHRMPVTESFPRVNRDTCDLCGTCNEICQFGAIVRAGQQVLTYPDLCHGCGGCRLVCPLDAITEVAHEIGVVETGHAGPIGFAHGILHIGRPRAVPVIKALKSAHLNADLIILDSPPGTSCPVVETVRGTDFVVLVTEPTPFAFHDLKLAAETIKSLGLPCGVVVNRAGLDDAETRSYCQAQQIPILAEIPDDLRLAKGCSGGLMAVDVLPDLGPRFRQLLSAVKEQVCQAGVKGEGLDQQKLQPHMTESLS